MANTITSQDADSIIDNALLSASNPTLPTTGSTSNESGLEPGPLPTDVPVDESNLTSEQKKQRADDEKIRQAQEDMLGEEQAKALREEQRKQEERDKTLLGVAEKLLNQGKSTAKGAGVKIGNLPTPGDITVPLILLVLFFFILITYAGHTRLQWLWLVLTSNAYVTGDGQPAAGTGGGPPVASQETLVGVVSLPSFSANGAYGSPYS